MAATKIQRFRLKELEPSGVSLKQSKRRRFINFALSESGKAPK
jgi:hypothetical protein